MFTLNMIRHAMLLSVLLSLGLASRLKERQTVDDYMNICLDGTNHKEKPGPESRLYAQCSPWQKRSCCREDTTNDINYEKNFLNFNWDHCKDLSLACRQHFIQDLCFYECSPNVGPWLVEDVRKIRTERYVGVPLCESDCLQWWHACENEFTCVENWAEEFDWSTGNNTCPEGSTCRPFNKVYDGAHHFCENIFGPSFKVVEENPADQQCFHLWFDPKYPNPNEAVARKEVARLLGSNESVILQPNTLFLALLVFAHSLIL